MTLTPESIVQPLEWHKGLVAVDEQGWVFIRPSPESGPLDFHAMTPEGWCKTASASTELAQANQRIKWLEQDHEPSPVIAKVIEDLRRLASTSDTARAEAYAHASVIFQNALSQNKP